MDVSCCVCGRSDSQDVMLCFSWCTENNSIILSTATEDENLSCFVCRDPDCLSQFFKEKHVSRQQARELLKDVRSLTESRTIAEKLIGMSVRSGNAARGVTQVFEGLKNQRISVIIVAKSQKKNTRDKILSAAKKFNVPVYEYMGTASFEQAVGKKQCTCVGIFGTELSEQIKSDLHVIKN